MERHGIKVDRAELNRLSADFGQRMVELEKQIHELAGGRSMSAHPSSWARCCSTG
ncbi:MAG: hypothetical protein WDN69_06290 [Aliidongia sp.]